MHILKKNFALVFEGGGGGRIIKGKPFAHVKIISFRGKIVNRRRICFQPTLPRRCDGTDFHRSGNYDSTEFFLLLDSFSPLSLLRFYGFIVAADKFYVTMVSFFSLVVLRNLFPKGIKSVFFFGRNVTFYLDISKHYILKH